MNNQICLFTDFNENEQSEKVKSAQFVSDIEYLMNSWDWERNNEYGYSPYILTVGSNKSVWWKCADCGNSWTAKISNRVHGTGCPKCAAGYKVSASEQVIFYYVNKFFPDAIQTYRAEWLERKELDIYIPELKLAVEYDGEVWHNSPNKDIEKGEMVSKQGITLVRFREENLPLIEDGSVQISVPTKNYSPERLKEPLIRFFEYINEHYRQYICADINLPDEYLTILASSSKQKLKRSLAVNYPEIAKDWDYELNKGLTPEQVFSSSNIEVWWHCEKDHKWKSSVSNRLTRNCPILLGNKR